MVESHDTEKRKRLAVDPDKFLAPLAEPRPGRRLKPAAQLWQKSGSLLVAERLWLNTARVSAMCASTPVLSNVWWPINTDNHLYDKALTVWLNCSLGLLTLLATRNTTRGSWVKFKKSDLRSMPVLDVRALPLARLQNLAQLFDKMSNAEFDRLPAMHHCPARRHLDESLAQILNLPNLTTLRHLLATEPTISNQRL